MSASTITAAGRRAVEQQMVDTCVINKLVRSDDIDEATGEYLLVPTVIYTGPCKFKTAVFRVEDVDSQGQDFAVANGILSIPVDAPGSADVGKDHVATITIRANDSATITAIVQSGFAQTYATARRFPVSITT